MRNNCAFCGAEYYISNSSPYCCDLCEAMRNWSNQPLLNLCKTDEAQFNALIEQYKKIHLDKYKL